MLFYEYKVKYAFNGVKTTQINFSLEQLSEYIIFFWYSVLTGHIDTQSYILDSTVQ